MDIERRDVKVFGLRILEAYWVTISYVFRYPSFHIFFCPQEDIYWITPHISSPLAFVFQKAFLHRRYQYFPCFFRNPGWCIETEPAMGRLC